MAVPAAGVNVGGAQSANNRWIASAFVMRLRFPPRAVEGQLRVVANGLFRRRRFITFPVKFPFFLKDRILGTSYAFTHRFWY
jgi:hypothetical protein